MKIRASRLALLATVPLLACSSAASRMGRPVPVPPPAEPVPVLIERLRGERPAERARAGWALARIESPDREVIAAVVAALDDPDETVRDAAAWALGSWPASPDASEAFRTAYEAVPKLLRQTPPHYPEDAFRAKVEGTVLVAFLVGADGRVVHAQVRKSVPGLDDAALSTIQSWLFEPARRSGRPTPCFAHSPVRFKIFR